MHYREHLRVPTLWWILGLSTMTTFAVVTWAGFSLMIGVIIFVVVVVGPALALTAWGHATVEVADGELRAGRRAFPLSLAGHVQVLDKAQTSQLRGPMADPSAFMWIRPYLRRSVYVEVAGDNPDTPYWLIGTRHPEALAAAIDRSRPQSRADDPSMA